MAAHSKLYDEIIRSGQCYNDLIHAGPCGRNALRNAYRFPYSNLLYFAPVVFVPLLLKLKQIDKNVLRKTFKYYLNCVMTGSAVGWTIAVMICVFRHTLGRFTYYGTVFWPTFVGSLWTYLFGARVLHLYQTSTFQGALEAYINTRSNFITKSILSSVVLQCWIFMCCSALILHARQNGFLKGFWFLTPSPKDRAERPAEEQPPTICTHTDTDCRLHLAKGVRIYAMIGISVDILRMLMSQVRNGGNQLGFVDRLLAKCRNFRLQSTAIFASYIAIYRFTQCYLNRKSAATPELNHLLAAFLGGICYIFYPKQALLSYSLVLSTPVLWHIITSHESFKQNAALAGLRAIPFAKLLYPFALAYLVHMYLYHKNCVQGMSLAIINGLTDSYAKRIKITMESRLKNLLQTSTT